MNRDPMTREQGQALLDELREIKQQQRRTNALFAILVDAIVEDAGTLCPECGSNQVAPSSTFGSEGRNTCSSCGVSFDAAPPEPAQEVPVG